MSFFRFLSLITWSFPTLVLLVSFGAIAAQTGNTWPWHEVVHESGNRSLIGTILYFEHASRELWLDLVLGVAVGGCSLWALPGSHVTTHHLRGFLSAAIVLVIGGIIVGTLYAGGSALLWDNLLQMHTRPGESLGFGSHWRYHFLSRIVLMLVSFGMAGLVVLGLRGKNGAGHRPGQLVFLAALGLFLLLSMVFDPDLNPFVDPVFLGHQLREVLTHGLVTLPLAWWLCLVFSGNEEISDNGAASFLWPLVAGIVGIFIAVYLLVGVIVTSAASMGQSESLSLLIFPHFFEHTFSYLLVPLIAARIRYN